MAGVPTMAGSGERRAVMSTLSKCWYVPFCSSATGPPNSPDLPEFTCSPDTLSAQYHCLTYLFRWGAAHACSLAPFGRERPSTRGYVDKDFFCSKKVFFFLHYFLLKRFGTMEASLHPKASPLGSARTSAFSRLGVSASIGSRT